MNRCAYRRRWLSAAMLSAALLSSGCTSPDSGPSADPLHSGIGIWQGRISDLAFGEGTLRLVLPYPVNGAFEGTWSVSFPKGKFLEGAATSRDGIPDRMIIHMHCSSGGYASLLVTISAGYMTGAFASFACSEFGQGTVDLMKQ